MTLPISHTPWVLIRQDTAIRLANKDEFGVAAVPPALRSLIVLRVNAHEQLHAALQHIVVLVEHRTSGAPLQADAMTARQATSFRRAISKIARHALAKVPQ